MITSERDRSIQGMKPVNHSGGLSSQEAALRLTKYGPNAVAEEKQHPLLSFLRKFWGPVSWMLEITVILELILGKGVEAIIIATLLVVNAVLSFVQENHADVALTRLRQQLTVQSRVFRDGHWQMVPAQNLVPGDVIHLRLGDLVPTDMNLMEGQVQMDESSLTGESAPVDGTVGQTAYAGAIVKRGEASGVVIATGSRTKFGETAELVRTAKTATHLEEIVFSIVRYLVIADIVLAILVVLFATYAQIPWHEILPYVLILLVASVPVALPAMFTLATALGASDLAQIGVLVTRLSAIEEAAGMSVLASDKTGTLTENELTLSTVYPYPPYSEEEVIRLGAFASEESTQDPLDLAILNAARGHNLNLSGEILHFTPFDPATKRSDAMVRLEDGNILLVIKGAPLTIAALSSIGAEIEEDVKRLAAKGYRVLAVAASTREGPLHLAGLVALQDAPRPDSQSMIRNLNDLGVRVLMITGDDLLTAQAIASQVGISGQACSADSLHTQLTPETLGCNIFAGVYPEDKFHLVRAFQDAGEVVGMTGDGVNDAPALKQAEVGIAVASATDVAKAAASLVLTSHGLSNVLDAVKTSRRIYQRMLTYTLNKIIKTFQIALFLSLGFIVSKEFVVTPLLIVLLLFANDFVTMSIATDHVSYSQKPDRWHIRTLMLVAFLLAIPALLISFAFFYAANNLFHLPLPEMQTLMFVMLVFTGQANVYLVRERHHFWHSFPSRWMIFGSVVDVVVVSILATQGILMTAIPLSLVVFTLVVVLLYLPVVDYPKIAVFKYARMG